MTAFDDPAGFVWAVGEEGSDPIVDLGGRDHRHDQFAQSGHLDRRVEDLADIARLGVRWIRYGSPWRLAEPEPGRYDWSGWDEALGACEAAGLEPIVDLLHFGLPDRYTGFVDPAWVEGFVRYVEAFAARYPKLRWFTPVNEPGITALMSARFGLWNDRLASRDAHARALANVVLANLEAIDRLRTDRDAWWIASEGFDVPVAMTRGAREEVERRRALGWLVWDLHLGVEPAPAVSGYLDPVDPSVLRRIGDMAIADRLVAGHDVYPTSVQPVQGARPPWTVADLVRLAADELERWHDRYEHPFWIAETSNLTLPPADQVPWLDALTGALGQLRSDGRPVRGLCWYSRGDQFDWQTGLADPTGAVTEVGLFDTERRPRPVAARFAALVSERAPSG